MCGRGCCSVGCDNRLHPDPDRLFIFGRGWHGHYLERHAGQYPGIVMDLHAAVGKMMQGDPRAAQGMPGQGVLMQYIIGPEGKVSALRKVRSSRRASNSSAASNVPVQGVKAGKRFLRCAAAWQTAG